MRMNSRARASAQCVCLFCVQGCNATIYRHNGALSCLVSRASHPPPSPRNTKRRWNHTRPSLGSTSPVSLCCSRDHAVGRLMVCVTLEMMASHGCHQPHQHRKDTLDSEGWTSRVPVAVIFDTPHLSSTIERDNFSHSKTSMSAEESNHDTKQMRGRKKRILLFLCSAMMSIQMNNCTDVHRRTHKRAREK